MITPMQMYWLLKLDDIYMLVSYAAALATGVFVVSFLAYKLAGVDGNKQEQKTSGITALVSLVCSVLLWCVVTFIPTTKQMAAIYVVPAIVNNEKVQQIGNKTLDISEQLLDLTKEYLEKKTK